MFESIANNAKEVGMVINSNKTQLLCLNANKNCTVNSYIIADGKKVVSVDRMKILGFIFEDKLSVGAHIYYSINKFNRALWALNHLRRARIDNETLLKVYKIMLRPLLEYCSPVYHYVK